jgi:hypothetical protein
MRRSNRLTFRVPIVVVTAVAVIGGVMLGMSTTSTAVPAPPTVGKACGVKGERVPGFVCVKKKGKLVWAKAAANPSATPTSSASPAGSQPAAPTPALAGLATWSPTTSNALFTKGSQPIGSSISTSAAAVGTVFLCRLLGGAGGASAVGPWVSGSRWFPGQKVKVDGAHNLGGVVSIASAGGRRVISGNGLPATSLAGTFPIGSTTAAYQYDRNPNSIKGYSLSVSVPAVPRVAASPSCMDGGPIGYTTNGVAIYNALDGGNRDAAAYETLDKCWGHPERSGQYHFHTISSCVDSGSATVNSPVWGFMLDGFPITGPWENGVMLKTADLDVCHGKTSIITLDGVAVSMYHYVATEDYPYTAGCYRGSR